MVLGLGLGAGLTLGTLGAVALEAMDTTIRSAEEAEALAGCRRWPRFRESISGRKSSLFWPHVVEDGHAWNVISAKEPYSKAAESYGTLRSSLLLGEEGAAKVLVITSAMPAEGKTLTAVNCAAVLAQQGSKVLLVDADLRRSSLHRSLGIRKEPGLGDVLNGQCEAGEAAVTTENIPQLPVVSSGAAVTYPAEALASEMMAGALRQWRNEYDIW